MAGTGGVHRRGKVYWIYFSAGGQQWRESARTTNKQLALALLKKRQTEVFQGRYFPNKVQGELSMAELKERWLKHARTKGKRTVGHDERRFDRIIEFFGPQRRLSSIDRGDIEDFIEHLRGIERSGGKPYAPATINRHLALLRAAFNYAVEHSLVHANPARRLTLLPEDNERDRVCTVEEYDLLVAAADGELRLAIIIGYFSGMRLGEILGLRWDQVDLDERTFRLRAADTKTRRRRLVPMATPVVRALEALEPSEDGRLFHSRGDAMSVRFTALCRKLEIRGLRFHDLRHTAATNLRRAGVDIFTIKEITGHKTLAMLERYNTIDVEDLRMALERVEKRGGRRR